MNTSLIPQPIEFQHDLEISLDGIEYPALVSYYSSPDNVEVIKCLFNVTGSFWALLDDDHFHVVERQLKEALSAEEAENKLDRQIDNRERGDQ